MSELPIACSLRLAERRTRRDELPPGLVRDAVERIELPDGHRFRLDTTAIGPAAILATIERDRQCCRLVRGRVAPESDFRPIWLGVTGPAGTREFLGDRLAP
jgi:hypothetical protein